MYEAHCGTKRGHPTCGSLMEPYFSSRKCGPPFTIINLKCRLHGVLKMLPVMTSLSNAWEKVTRKIGGQERDPTTDRALNWGSESGPQGDKEGV